MYNIYICLVQNPSRRNCQIYNSSTVNVFVCKKNTCFMYIHGNLLAVSSVQYNLQYGFMNQLHVYVISDYHIKIFVSLWHILFQKLPELIVFMNMKFNKWNWNVASINFQIILSFSLFLSLPLFSPLSIQQFHLSIIFMYIIEEIIFLYIQINRNMSKSMFSCIIFVVQWL